MSAAKTIKHENSDPTDLAQIKIPVANIPPRRGEPLLIKQWKYLWRSEFVELKRGTRVVNTGWVDQVTEDGRILWIHLSCGMGRMMLHQDDGISIWRVDSRIYQDRPASARQATDW